MDIQVTQIIFQIINFSLVLLVLKKFVYKPILNVLDSRASRIKDGLEAAEKNLQIQDDLESEKDKILSETQKQADEMLAKAKIQADAMVKKAQQQAKADAKKSIAKEKQAFESLMQKETKELEAKLSSTVLAATEKILADVVDTKIGQNIIDKQIKSLKLD